MDKVHIIAEAGNNHNGNVQTGKQLIDVAMEAGADSIKFQMIYPEGLYLPAFYENTKYIENEVFKKRELLVLSDEAYENLAQYCIEKKIKFSASVFDHRGIDLLRRLNASYVKIASCDLNNPYLLKKAAEIGKKMVISTGMSSLGEIENAVNTIYSTGNSDIVIMHCVSVYPCPTRMMNLQFISTLKHAFGLPVGLSDHTESSIAAAIAVSMGVKWIEKHITLDRNSEGFDHVYAMEPMSFKKYIEDIRDAEKACQYSPNKIGEEEKSVRMRARRGLYAARDILSGEIIREEDILIVRPEGKLEPKDLPLIIGRQANVKIHKYEALSLSHFC